MNRTAHRKLSAFVEGVAKQPWSPGGCRQSIHERSKNHDRHDQENPPGRRDPRSARPRRRRSGRRRDREQQQLESGGTVEHGGAVALAGIVAATPGRRAPTGDTASKVRAAALAKVSGGTIQRVETDADGNAAHEAHILKADGSLVTVYVNKQFDVVGVENAP